MFYKLLNNNVVVDLLQEICYVRYLPKSKRWINTDALSAHGVLGSGDNKIYLLKGRACAYEELLEMVSVESITEEEYQYLAQTLTTYSQENVRLNARIEALEDALNKQTALLEQLLNKLG